MNFQHVRHATHCVVYGGLKLLVDPVLGNAGSYDPIPGVDNQRANPLVSLPMALESLLDADGILLTHAHRDHLDEAAREILPPSTPIICPPEFASSLEQYGFTDVLPLENSMVWHGIHITKTHGTHGVGKSAEYLNPVSGYVLQCPDEPVLYIAGDTVWCPQVQQTLNRFSPHVIVCFCGAARYSGDIITMGGGDLKRIHEEVPKARMIAIHMEAWNHCLEGRDALLGFAKAERFEKTLFIPADGEKLSFEVGGV